MLSWMEVRGYTQLCPIGVTTWADILSYKQMGEPGGTPEGEDLFRPNYEDLR